MKRIKDDVYGGSQFKRPFGSSRGESYAQSQVPGAGGVVGGGGAGAGGGAGGGSSASHKLTTNDALTYLKEVKDMFQDQREKYDMFLEVMKDFKAQRTDTAGVIARVKELFKGHNNLIFGFNTFLPKGYEITLDDDEAPLKKTVEFEEAITFVNKIKKRFQNDEHVYKSFLDILNMYRKEHKDINEVYREVASLFEDHLDLLDEFTRFLPDNSAMPMTHHVPYNQNSVQRYNERNSITPALRQMHVDKQRRRDRVVTSHAERDLSLDQPDMDDEKATLKVHKDQRKRTDKENRDRRNRDQDDRELEQDSSRGFGLQRFPNRGKSARKIEGYGISSNFSSYDEKDKNTYNQGFIFFEKVKERLGNSDDYQAFLKCLNIFSNGIIKRHDLQNLVTDLLGKYPDLMEEFNDFFERQNIDGFLAGVMSKKLLGTDGHVSKLLKMEDKDKEPKRELEGAREKERYKEKYMGKSIQELDLSNCERCTPSYRLLPDDYPIPLVSQRSELGAQVVNDYWVSVTSGSEDYSFKHMRRNQYEESLFRCEDDRFELDMLLESVSSTTKRAEDLLNCMNENQIEAPICIDDQFTALNLRCIERLYGDHGLDVMDILRKNPMIALPVILTRLKQKQEEWTRCRSDFNKVWAEIYAKNHYKSLDHRSFYFKQQDSKNLSAKSLVAEIRELKEQQQKEDDILLAFAAGNRQPLVPHIDYEYSDANIHEDIYKLVEYSCEEVCSTKEQFSKVMKLWTAFMEPMLGIVSLPRCKENSEDDGMARHFLMHCTTSSTTDNNGSHSADPATLKSKQPKLTSNGDENVSFLGSKNEDNLDSVKEDTSPVLDQVSKDDSAGAITKLEREQKDTSVIEIVSPVEVLSGQGIADSKTNLGAEHSHGRTSISGIAGGVASDENKLKTDIDAGPLSEGGIIGRPCLPANGMLMDGPSKTEREEGELSPNVDFEEDSFTVYGDAADQAMLKEKYNVVEIGQHDSENCGGLYSQDPGAENEADADADDEESENASEAGDDASGSESAGDECLREEHEEDEDVECDEVKAESEGEAEGVADAPLAEGDMPFPDHCLLSVKPLAKHITTSLLDKGRKDSWIFYGNDDFYVLFRLHQILYERILSAKTNSTGSETKWRTAKDASSSDPYARFLSALYSLLDGSADNVTFEDECRAIIGNQSYVLFTLDKLIYKLVKQLQAVAMDEMDTKLLQLYEYEKSRKSGKSIDMVYYDNVCFLLHDENIFRLEFSSAGPSRLSIQLMDNMMEKSEVLPVSVDPNFASYLHNDFLSVFQGKKEPHGITLQRNKHKCEGLDELSALSIAMEGVKMFNGLECKIACSSYKISYVLDTEDFFFRLRRKRKNPSQGKSSYCDQVEAGVERFHKFLMAS